VGHLQTLGCQPIAHIDAFTPDRLAHADLAEELSTPSGKIIKVTGVKNPGKTVSVLVRGSNNLVSVLPEISVVHVPISLMPCRVFQRSGH